MKKKSLLINKGTRVLTASISTACLIIAMIIITEPNWLDWNTKCLWLLGSIYSFLFVYFGMIKFTIPRITKFKNYKHILLLSSIIAILIILVVPIRFQSIVDFNRMQKRMMQNSVIQIDVLNEKDGVSPSNEVWIEGIRVDGKDYNLYNLKLSKGWQFVEDRAVAVEEDANPLIIELPPKSIYEVMIRKTPDTGKVKITIGNYSHIYDLHSLQLEQRAVVSLEKVFLNDEIKPYTFKRFIFYLIYFIFGYMVSILIIVYINRNKIEDVL